jgi:hypothetical protein
MVVAISPFGAKRIFDPDMSALLPGAKTARGRRTGI